MLLRSCKTNPEINLSSPDKVVSNLLVSSTANVSTTKKARYILFSGMPDSSQLVAGTKNCYTVFADVLNNTMVYMYANGHGSTANGVAYDYIRTDFISAITDTYFTIKNSFNSTFSLRMCVMVWY